MTSVYRHYTCPIEWVIRIVFQPLERDDDDHSDDNDDNYNECISIYILYSLFFMICSMWAFSEVSRLISYLARIFMMGLSLSHHWFLGIRCLKVDRKEGGVEMRAWEQYDFTNITGTMLRRRINEMEKRCEEEGLTQGRCGPWVLPGAGIPGTSFSCPAHRLSLESWQRYDLGRHTSVKRRQAVKRTVQSRQFPIGSHHVCSIPSACQSAIEQT